MPLKQLSPKDYHLVVMDRHVRHWFNFNILLNYWLINCVPLNKNNVAIDYIMFLTNLFRFIFVRINTSLNVKRQSNLGLTRQLLVLKLGSLIAPNSASSICLTIKNNYWPPFCHKKQHIKIWKGLDHQVFSNSRLESPYTAIFQSVSDHKYWLSTVNAVNIELKKQGCPQ